MALGPLGIGKRSKERLRFKQIICFEPPPWLGGPNVAVDTVGRQSPVQASLYAGPCLVMVKIFVSCAISIASKHVAFILTTAGPQAQALCCVRTLNFGLRLFSTERLNSTSWAERLDELCKDYWHTRIHHNRKHSF